MTKQEIEALIDAKIAGQGSAIDAGSALPTILKAIMDLGAVSIDSAEPIVGTSIVKIDQETQGALDSAVFLTENNDRFVRNDYLILNETIRDEISQLFQPIGQFNAIYGIFGSAGYTEGGELNSYDLRAVVLADENSYVVSLSM